MCLQHLWCLFNVPQQSDHLFMHSGCFPPSSLYLSPSAVPVFSTLLRGWATSDMVILIDSYLLQTETEVSFCGENKYLRNYIIQMHGYSAIYTMHLLFIDNGFLEILDHIKLFCTPCVHSPTDWNIELERSARSKHGACLHQSQNQNHIAFTLNLCNAPVCLASFSTVKIFALLSYFINF